MPDDAAADLWMRVRLRLAFTSGFIPRDQTMLSSAIRNGWGLRFAREWSFPPRRRG